MSSKAQIAASAKYDRANTTPVMLKLNNKNDSDILQQLGYQANKQKYIKNLIRKDMQNAGGVITQNSIKCLILPIAIKYGFDKIFLFGSYARKDATPDSDVDLFVEGGNITGLVQYAAALEDFQEALGRTVDLLEKKALIASPRESSKRMLRNIQREGILIYDKVGSEG